jgi:alpha-tubulin suppressor-like RCC1 family protein
MLAVKDDGTVWAWGWNSWSGAFPGAGMLGNGTTTNSAVPHQVLGLPNNIIQASGGDDFSAVLTADGNVWTFGANGAGQLGNGDPGLRQQLLPVKVVGLEAVSERYRNRGLDGHGRM